MEDFDKNVTHGAFFQTQYTSAMETIFMTLLSLKADVVLVFDKEGISFKELNPAKTIFISGCFKQEGNTYLFKGMNQQQFFVFVKLENIVNFFKFIKNSQSFITFWYNQEDDKYFHVEISNLEQTQRKNMDTTTLMMESRDEMELNPSSHMHTLIVNSHAWSSDIKTFNAFGSNLLLEIKDDQFIIKCNDGFEEVSSTYANKTFNAVGELNETGESLLKENSYIGFVEKGEDPYVCEKFNIKDLLNVSKATLLSNTLELKII
jgi:hypothetical protein